MSESYQYPKGKNIEVIINIQPVLKYADGVDIVGCQLTLTYNIDDNEVLRYGYIITYDIEGWKDFISGTPSRKDIANYLKDVWSSTVDYGRGVLEEKLKNTPFTQVLSIPDIPLKNLEENTQIMKV